MKTMVVFPSVFICAKQATRFCPLFMQHSWKWFIYYRCKNVNRPEVKSASDDGCPQKKRPKVIDRAVHFNPPENSEDSVSYGRHLEQLQAEQYKMKPRVEILKDLMKRTFPNRFSCLLQGDPTTASDYLKQFPLLKKAAYVCIN